MATPAVTARAKELTHVVEFLNTEFPEGIQMFNTRSRFNDPMERIYTSRCVSIDWNKEEKEYGGFVEIFGLTDEEFQMVKLVVEYRIKVYHAH